VKVIFVDNESNKDIEFIEVADIPSQIFFSCVQKKHHFSYNDHEYYVTDIKHIYKSKDGRKMMHIEFYVQVDREDLYDSKQRRG
jgi:hypothetical protein